MRTDHRDESGAINQECARDRGQRPAVPPVTADVARCGHHRAEPGVARPGDGKADRSGENRV